MASVQWGATATARLVFTPISTAQANLPNGAGTLAVLWKPNGLSDALALTDSGLSAYYHSIWNASGNNISDDDGMVVTFGPTAITVASWYITVVDWAAGAASTERFHHKNLTSGAAWANENSSGNNGGNRAGPGTSGWIRIGAAGDSNAASGMQIALAAFWAGTRLSDADVAALSANLKTSDWYQHSAGTPTFISEITSTAPTDLTGNATFSPGNSVTTNLTVGSDPAGGWTFDGAGNISGTAPPGTAYLPHRFAGLG